MTFVPGGASFWAKSRSLIAGSGLTARRQ